MRTLLPLSVFRLSKLCDKVNCATIAEAHPHCILRPKYGRLESPFHLRLTGLPVHRGKRRATEDTGGGVANLPASTRSCAWLYGTLGLVFLRALPNLRFPLERDSGTYCLVAEGMIHGLRLYRDLWDNKPPGIFYLYVPIVKLFGPVMWCVGVMDIVWLLLISFCIFRFVQRYLGAPAAAIAVLFNAGWHSTQGYVHAGQPETYLMLCIFTAYLLMLPEGRWPWARWLLVGLVMGAAFWLKYNAVVFLPLVMVLPVADFSALDAAPPRLHLAIPLRLWIVQSVVVVAGFFLSVTAMLVNFWMTGVWPWFMEEQIEVLPRYGAMVFERTHPLWLIAIFQTYRHLLPWNEAIVAIALLIAWKRKELFATAPIFLMGLAGYTLTASQGRFHPYYFETTYPFIAMCWGYAWVRVFQGFKGLSGWFAQRRWKLAQVALLFVFLNLIYATLITEVFRINEQYHSLVFWYRDRQRSYAEYLWQIDLEKLHDQMAVIDYLKRDSAPQDEVYVWGTAPAINFLSQRRPATRFVSNLGLISPWGLKRWRFELVDKLRTKPPRFIVVARHDPIAGVSYTQRDSEEMLQSFPALAEFIGGKYRSVKNFYDFEVYELKRERRP